MTTLYVKSGGGKLYFKLRIVQFQLEIKKIALFITYYSFISFYINSSTYINTHTYVLDKFLNKSFFISDITSYLTSKTFVLIASMFIFSYVL